jgi:hypothetical protein
MGQWRRAGPGPQKHPRISARVPARISTVHPELDPDTGDSFYRIVEETTADLSRGGAFVESWEPLHSGRQVLVEIDLPDGPPLQIVARVAWTRRQLCGDALRRIGRDSSFEASRRQANEAGGALTGPGPGYGLEFIGGSKADLARLDAHLKSIQPGPGPDVTEASAPTPGASSPSSSSSLDASPNPSLNRQGPPAIPRP